MTKSRSQEGRVSLQELAFANTAEVILLIGFLAKTGAVSDEEMQEQVYQLCPQTVQAPQARHPESS